MNRAYLWTALVTALVWSSPSGAQVPPPIDGKWVNTTVMEVPMPAQPCRPIKLEQREYHLQRGVNASVQGFYRRTVLTRWLIFNPGCQLPGTHADPNYQLRIDNWILSGTFTTEGDAETRATHLECDTDCTEDMAVPEFSTTLRLASPGLIDLGLTQGEAKRFIPLAQAEAEEASATEALRGLVEPLIQGDCTAFVAGSLHPDVRDWTKPDDYCSVVGPYGQQFTGVIYDKPLFAYRLAHGVFGYSGPVIPVREGDVLVERAFVLTQEGGNLPMPAVLRRDATGDWKVAYLL